MTALARVALVRVALVVLLAVDLLGISVLPGILVVGSAYGVVVAIVCFVVLVTLAIVSLVVLVCWADSEPMDLSPDLPEARATADRRSTRLRLVP